MNTASKAAAIIGTWVILAWSFTRSGEVLGVNSEAHRYMQGYYALFAFLCLCVGVVVTWIICLWEEN